eukprot:11989237-Alexandrium_andersonii.AAC.1
MPRGRNALQQLRCGASAQRRPVRLAGVRGVEPRGHRREQVRQRHRQQAPRQIHLRPGACVPGRPYIEVLAALLVDA